MTRQEILEATEFCREHNLPSKGIHFHQGSNFRDPEPLIPAIDMALDSGKGNWIRQVNGISVRAAAGAWHIMKTNCRVSSIERYVRGIAELVIEGCRQRGLELPAFASRTGKKPRRAHGVSPSIAWAQ